MTNWAHVRALGRAQRGTFSPGCTHGKLMRARISGPSAARGDIIRGRAAAALGVSRAVGAPVARRLSAFGHSAESAERVPLTTNFEAQAGAGRLRPLKLTDESAWTLSRRKNAERMRPWWPGAADWRAATGHDAFLDHYVAWTVKRQRRSGVVLAIMLSDTLVGEMTLTAQHEGRSVAVGLWALPEFFSDHETWGVIGALFDELFFRRSVVRMDAPVAVGNENPRGLLEVAGFRWEGTMAQWRPLGDAMVDHDLFGLTRDRWLQVRRDHYAAASWDIHPDARAALSVAEANQGAEGPTSPGRRV